MDKTKQKIELKTTQIEHAIYLSNPKIIDYNELEFPYELKKVDSEKKFYP